MKKEKSRIAKPVSVLGAASVILGAATGLGASSAMAHDGYAALGNGTEVRAEILRVLNGQPGMMLAEHETGHKASAEGKCGEGKCGEGKKGKTGEGKCGEGKAGKTGEGKCGEGKCGEGKAGKTGEAKCGEGKEAPAAKH